MKPPQEAKKTKKAQAVQQQERKMKAVSNFLMFVGCAAVVCGFVMIVLFLTGANFIVISTI